MAEPSTRRPERLLLIDGNSLLFRAFHALPPLTSPSGELTNATYGFTTMLLSAYRELRPTYTAAAFDTKAPTFRHTDYEAYKATRGPAPEGISHQFGRVFQILDAMHVPIYRVDGFEADDIIGTLARQARERGLEVIILTGDMDAAQLVAPEVRLLVPVQGVSKTRLYTVEAVRERYGLEPAQIPDFKALRGDVSDNIPGVPGIGDKTAARLLAEYGTVENLIAHLPALPEKLRRGLAPYAEQVAQAKRLATIVCDAPVRLELPERVPPPDRAALLDLFHTLGFRSLLDRLDELGDGEGERGRGQEPDAEGQQASETSGGGRALRQARLFEAPEAGGGHADASDGVAWAQTSAAGDDPLGRHVPNVVADLETLAEVARRLRAQPRIVVHVLTAGGPPMRADLLGLALGGAPSADSGQAAPFCYVPVGHTAPCLAWETARPILQPLLEDERLPKLAHNAKEQMLVLERYGVQLRGLAFDTMIAAYLLHSGQRALELRDLAWSLLQVELPSLTNLTGSGKKTLALCDVDPERVAAAAIQAAELVGRLEPLLARELEATQLSSLYCEVELPLLPVLAEMERTGVKVDVDYLGQLSRSLFQRLAELEQEIYRHVGHQFNINSTQQLSAVLFDELRLPSLKKTRTGHVSTGAEVLEELRGLHPIIELLLEYRQLQKLKSTYVDALPALVHPRTGRVHTSFNQTVAATGRLSSSDPNLQNIPIRTELGRQVRRAFVAGEPGWVLLSADYSQIELRILAHVTQDPTLLEAFARGEDIHAATAAEVLGVPIAQVSPEQRRLAKVVNFGVLYGMSEYGLASRTDLPQAEAAAFIERYFQRFATIKDYQERVIREVERLGYASTLLGRRRYIPELRSPIRAVREAGVRQAINMPIQGTAADVVKIAMVRVHRAMHDQNGPGGWFPLARMLLQVHDELLFELPESELSPFVDLVCPIMETAMELTVPLRVELKAGRNWDEMASIQRKT